MIITAAQSYVEFRLNAPYEELLHWLSVSSIGISTMVEEHFGIGVVEFMVSLIHCGAPLSPPKPPFGEWFHSNGPWLTSALTTGPSFSPFASLLLVPD